MSVVYKPPKNVEMEWTLKEVIVYPTPRPTPSPSSETRQKETQKSTIQDLESVRISVYSWTVQIHVPRSSCSPHF